MSADALAPIATRLSEVFLDHPEVEWSRVFTEARAGRRILVDSDGTRVLKPVRRVVVRAVGRIRAEDGSQVTDHASWTVSTPDQLPPLDEMVAATEALAERLEGWAALDIPDEDYVGPVLFEGPAAVEVVRRLVLPALYGTPPAERPPSGSRAIMFDEDEATAVRVKRRLLPPGFHVRDDPTADPSLPSAFDFDDEGVRAQPVDLVVDGVIRTHFASRTPSDDVRASNGHARGYVGELHRGMASQTTLWADRPVPARKLHKLALAQAAAYGLDHYVVVRRTEDEEVQEVADLTWRASDPPALLQPVVAARVYADGREEPIRGVHFAGVDHRALRDVVAAGRASHTETTLVAPPDGWGGILRGLPVTVTAPELLVGEVELRAGGAGGEKPPELPSPLAAR